MARGPRVYKQRMVELDQEISSSSEEEEEEDDRAECYECESGPLDDADLCQCDTCMELFCDNCIGSEERPDRDGWFPCGASICVRCLSE
jgi:hypothetical protein